MHALDVPFGTRARNWLNLPSALSKVSAPNCTDSCFPTKSYIALSNLFLQSFRNSKLELFHGHRYWLCLLFFPEAPNIAHCHCDLLRGRLARSFRENRNPFVKHVLLVWIGE